MLGPLATWYNGLIEFALPPYSNAQIWRKRGRTPEWVLPFFCGNALLGHYQILRQRGGRL